MWESQAGLNSGDFFDNLKVHLDMANGVGISPPNYRGSDNCIGCSFFKKLNKIGAGFCRSHDVSHYTVSTSGSYVCDDYNSMKE